MKLPSPRHDGATPGGHEKRMTAMRDTIMFFDHEGFSERNAIRSALGGKGPDRFDQSGSEHSGFDRAAFARLLRRALRRADSPREQARAA